MTPNKKIDKKFEAAKVALSGTDEKAIREFIKSHPRQLYALLVKNSDIYKHISTRAMEIMLENKVLRAIVSSPINDAIGLYRDELRRRWDQEKRFDWLSRTIIVGRKDLFDMIIGRDWLKGEEEINTLMFNVIKHGFGDQSADAVRVLSRTSAKDFKIASEVLYYAAHRGRGDIIDALADLGENISVVADKMLFEAANAHHIDLGVHLVMRYGADVLHAVNIARNSDNLKAVDILEKEISSQLSESKHSRPVVADLSDRVRELEETVRELTTRLEKIEEPLRPIRKTPILGPNS